jgi:hypothetical protein
MAPHLLLYRKLLYAFLPPLFSFSPIMTLRYRMKPPRSPTQQLFLFTLLFTYLLFTRLIA